MSTVAVPLVSALVEATCPTCASSGLRVKLCRIPLDVAVAQEPSGGLVAEVFCKNCKRPYYLVPTVRK